MKCPHCQSQFHGNPSVSSLREDKVSHGEVVQHLCANPECGKMVLFLLRFKIARVPGGGTRRESLGEVMVYPKFPQKGEISNDIPDDYSEDIRESSVVLPISPKASAALSRRCLQHIIRQHFGIKEKTLYQEIEKLIASGKIPMYIAESIDAIRHYGNFAAHPANDISTGEVIAVEDGEAEWTMELVLQLCEFCFVQPAAAKRKRDALNQKLIATGKPPMP